MTTEAEVDQSKKNINLEAIIISAEESGFDIEQDMDVGADSVAVVFKWGKGRR
jgi:hypothetical protein